MADDDPMVSNFQWSTLISVSKNSSFETVQKVLQYNFKDLALLKLALTHASMGKDKNNERLEFLGDRVLGLAIAELLNGNFPEAPEGELARRFNRLVKKDTCAIVAQELELGPYIIMGEGERESGGSEKPTILADACEAILGAIFLDSGYLATKELIFRMWSPKLLSSDVIPTDPKSALQEWAQSKRLALPKYSETRREGPDHAPQFTTEVRIDGLEPAHGAGTSKRASEQEAARTMLRREGIWKDTEYV